LEGIKITIYLDIILLMNILCNYALLFMTNYFAKSGKRWYRLLIGATIATTLIPLYLYFPNTYFQTIWMKVLFSLLIILCTFGYNNVQRFIKQVGLFYITTFAAGGTLFAVHYMFQPIKSDKVTDSFWFVSNIHQEEIHIAVLLLGFPIALLILKKVMDRQVTDKMQYDQLYTVWVEMLGKKEMTSGYVDSGNQLSDPLTNRPVIICDTAFLTRFFSEEEWGSIQDGISSNDMSLFPENIQHKFSIIPYQGVGGETGCLYTIRPDNLNIYMDGEILTTTQVLIGIQLGKLTADEAYHCLLQPTLIKLKMMQSA